MAVETIVISADRMKIMLSREELKRYCLDGAALDTENERVQSTLRRVIEEAGRQSGFDTARSRMHVQVYESRAGGCEMFVTLLPREILEETAERTLYGFRDREELVMLCRRLRDDGYDAPSAAYRLDGSYFLILEGLEPYAACDFGVLTDRVLHPYITEYGECLMAENAVARVAAAP